jgi:hypothetical protein
VTPYTFLKCQPKKIIEQVAERAGTNFQWFRQVAHGHGKFSNEMAVALEEASKHYALSESDGMTFNEIQGIDKLRVERKKELRKK